MAHQDSSFIKSFASVVAGLVVFSVGLAIFAGLFQQQITQEVSEARLEAVEERIKPIGAVYAGEAGQQALAKAAEPEQAAGGEASSGSSSEPMSGQQVYQDVCAACHDTGAGGSPKLEPAAWEDRLAKGEDTLINHAINGFQGEAGMMPAKGGRMDLSDAEVEKAVDYMIAQVEGN